MLHPDPQQEARFFQIVHDYFDLERDTARHYGHGEYTLARMDRLAEVAGHPERGLRIVHVAGTKGKGSTCFFLAELLRTAGVRCGVYSSPHLLTVRERFRIDGSPVGYGDLLAGAAEYRDEVSRAGIRPTLFEFMTVLALRLFLRAGCRVAVLETGIGGLMDATNYVVAPAACAITSISYDHVQLLGNTLAEIAAQKAGILKAGVPAVLGAQPYREAAAVVRATARRVGAPLHPPVPAAALARWPLGDAPSFLCENFRTALALCRVLGVRPEPARFRMPEMPGRFQVLREAPPVVIDAAHNADSAERLVAALGQRFPGVRFVTVLGVVAGKDTAGIFRALCPVTHEFLFTHPRTTYKGSELTALTDLARAAGVAFRVAPRLASASELPASEPLLFTGSFFTASIGAELVAARA
jgi:dihydrofolate synthase/folylpolyglutamate synthase